MAECNRLYISSHRDLRVRSLNSIPQVVINKVQYKKTGNNVHFILSLKKTKGEIAQKNKKTTDFWFYASSSPSPYGTGEWHVLYHNYFRKNDQDTTVEFSIHYPTLERYANVLFVMTFEYWHSGSHDGLFYSSQNDSASFYFADLEFKDLYGVEF